MKKLRILDQTRLPRSGIIRAAEVKAITRASNVIAETEAWSKEQRESLIDHVEAERVAAYADAYAEGLKELMDAASLHREATRRMAEKIRFLVRKSVHHIFEKWPTDELLEATIGPVLEDVEKEGEIAVSVHPDRATDLRRALKAMGSEDQTIMVTEEASLPETGCVVYTPSDVINVSVDVLVDQLMEGLAGYFELAETAQVEEMEEIDE